MYCHRTWEQWRTALISAKPLRKLLGQQRALCCASPENDIIDIESKRETERERVYLFTYMEYTLYLVRNRTTTDKLSHIRRAVDTHCRES